MDQAERMLLMTRLIEIYDHEIAVNRGFLGLHHLHCKKCQSLLAQRKKMIIEIKKELGL